MTWISASARRLRWPERSTPTSCWLTMLLDGQARRRHLRVTGTLGVLRVGAEHGCLDVPEVLARLKATSFYADEALIASIFAEWQTMARAASEENALSHTRNQPPRYLFCHGLLRHLTHFAQQPALHDDSPCLASGPEWRFL